MSWSTPSSLVYKPFDQGSTLPRSPYITRLYLCSHLGNYGHYATGTLAKTTLVARNKITYKGALNFASQLVSKSNSNCLKKIIAKYSVMDHPYLERFAPVSNLTGLSSGTTGELSERQIGFPGSLIRIQTDTD
jgi:hypothetical protein